MKGLSVQLWSYGSVDTRRASEYPDGHVYISALAEDGFLIEVAEGQMVQSPYASATCTLGELRHWLRTRAAQPVEGISDATQTDQPPPVGDPGLPATLTRRPTADPGGLPGGLREQADGHLGAREGEGIDGGVDGDVAGGAAEALRPSPTTPGPELEQHRGAQAARGVTLDDF